MVYEGTLAELRARGRDGLPPAHDRRRPRAGGVRRRSRGSRTPRASSTAGSRFRAPTRPRSASCRCALAEAGALDPRAGAPAAPRSRTCSSRSPRATATPAADAPAPAVVGRRGMRPGVLDRLPLGAAASCASRSAPTSASAPRRSCRSSSWSPSRRRTASPTTSPSGATSTTTGLAIPLVLLLFGSIWMFPLITALVAGRHRRRRGPQRHAEDDPHALGRARRRSSSARRSPPRPTRSPRSC